MQADRGMRRCVGRVGDDARFQNFRHTDTDGKASTFDSHTPYFDREDNKTRKVRPR